MRPERLSGPGLVLAVAAGSLAVLPSLVPRSGPIQGLLLGVLAVLGYGLGTAVWRLTGRDHPRPRWWLLLVPLAALLIGWRWQQELAALTGVPGPRWTCLVVSAVAAAATFLLLLTLARGVRALTRWMRARLTRVAPPRVAAAGAVTVSALVLVVAADRLPGALVTALDPLFARMSATTPAGVEPPASRHVSGGPASAVPWSALGGQGQQFVAGVTPTAALRAFSGEPARAPVRAFVGVDTAGSPEERAAAAVAELERLGGFDRAVIAVGTSAGAGTVDPGEVTPLEYLTNGDVATVSTQYSVLPSFLSFLVDRPDSVAAATTLLEAVRARARTEPDPPRILVFGESLGAYGSSGVFPDLPAAMATVDGALWQGPPNATPLWRALTQARLPDTPERLPVLDAGRNVRWANVPADLQELPGPFDAPRFVFLQNASDPVVWWSPALLLQRPDWLAEPRGPGVLPWLPWLPVVTFAGVTGDLMNSQGVPPGHGHVYGTAAVYAWAHVLAPPGWSGSDSERLAQHLR